MSRSTLNQSSKAVSSRNTFETLENRQMMSASLANHSVAVHDLNPASLHIQAVSVSLQHATKQGSQFGGATPNAKPASKASPFADGKVVGASQPTVTMNGLYLKSYSNYPLFSASGPSMNDVNQGATGDCYFMSALAEEAAHDPARIRSLCHQRSDGTYDVYFYNHGWVDEHVDGLLPVYSNGNLAYAGLGQGNCTWVAIMEKAFCYFRAGEKGVAPSYHAIDTGTCAEGFGTTGQGIIGDYFQNSFSGGYSLANYVYGQVQSNHDVELMTSGTGGSLITHHAYAVISAMYGTDGNLYIEVRNPWGRGAANGQPYTWVNANTVFSQMADVVVAYA